MKGILLLLFMCATFYLANGNSCNYPDGDDKAYECLPDQYREDWKRFREAMLKQLQHDLDSGKKGPVTILGEAVMDTIILLLGDTPKARSAEGQRRSDLSDLHFRDSSMIPRSGTDGENVGINPAALNNDAPVPGQIFPRGTLGKGNDTNSTDEKCFVRHILDLISLLVTNAYDEDIRKSGHAPAGPKMLDLLVHELSENLENLNEIEILDEALFKILNLCKELVGRVKLDIQKSYKETPELNAIVKLLSKIESFLDSDIKADREMAAGGDSIPAIRLLLDQVESTLEELIEGKNASNSTNATGLSSLRKFLAEARSTLVLVILGKWDKETESIPLTKILNSIKRALGITIEEIKTSEHKSGTLNYMILNIVTSIHSRLGEILVMVDPKNLLG